MTYTVTILNKTNSVYQTFATYTSADTNADFTQSLTMSALKTAAGYADTDNGD